MSDAGEGCRLYLVTPPALDPLAFHDPLARALDAGDVAAVQLRLKAVDDDALRRAVDALRPRLLSTHHELAAQDAGTYPLRHFSESPHEQCKPSSMRGY